MAPPSKGSSDAESVRVIVRARPLSDKEEKMSWKNALDVDVQRGQVQILVSRHGSSYTCR
eukprot:1160228-Pelagomonas_calceolata.AAC.1